MDGPQHYRAAERLADKAHRLFGEKPAKAEFLMRSAQVHATLAAAAAAAYPAIKDYHGDEGTEPYEWTMATKRTAQGQEEEQ